MLEVGALYRIYYCPVDGTSRVNSACGATGEIIVFSGFGAFINSAGGAGISIFGTKRVNGLPHAARNKKESATRNLISQPPLSSMASLACQEDQYLIHDQHFVCQQTPLFQGSMIANLRVAEHFVNK
jgi:hypothetical protein